MREDSSYANSSSSIAPRRTSISQMIKRDCGDDEDAVKRSVVRTRERLQELFSTHHVHHQGDDDVMCPLFYDGVTKQWREMKSTMKMFNMKNA